MLQCVVYNMKCFQQIVPPVAARKRTLLKKKPILRTMMKLKVARLKMQYEPSWRLALWKGQNQNHWRTRSLKWSNLHLSRGIACVCASRGPQFALYFSQRIHECCTTLLEKVLRSVYVPASELMVYGFCKQGFKFSGKSRNNGRTILFLGERRLAIFLQPAAPPYGRRLVLISDV